MVFNIRTDRLIIRAVTASDAPALAARRSDPEVAKYQDWSLPFTLADADRICEAVAALVEPPDDEWFMATITRHDGEILGDFGMQLGFSGRTAEIGYTFARDQWGNGFAVEAVGALVDHLLFERSVQRVGATLHPDNIRSAHVLERSGFLFEGQTRRSHWDDEGSTDAWIYGLTREDRTDWRVRPRESPREVRLVPITPDNDIAVRSLATHHSQIRFASPVLKSFADALVPEVIDGAPVVPWYRAVEADGQLVAFLMLTEITDAHPEPFLWRLLVDRRHQRRGIGTRVLELVVDQCLEWGASSMSTTWVEGNGSPRPLYEGFGFVPTGELIEGETEGRLRFDTLDTTAP
ncbi:MAG: GNAT family N-acetyltransferase [Acidimicrobiales bacterium]